MSIFVNIVFLCTISSNFVFGQSGLKNPYNYSAIISIPDLSFINTVYTGLDVLEQMDFSPLNGKNIAILTNSTAVNRNSEHLLDILKRNGNINVSYLFAMEHGLWSIDDKRAKMMGRDNIDPVHNAPIIDLFNTYLYPPHWVMDKIDLVLVDFQITGSRYPTYLATLSKVFESASNFNVPVLILDRPNPLRGDIIDGPIPRTGYQSFEAYHLLPIRHGLTLGEVSLMINEMGWTKNSKRIKLSIIPTSNWSRDMWYDETELPWKTPIPLNLNQESLLLYCGMDLFRGTNLNIGFGTDMPYSLIGAPWLETSFLLEKINELSLPGVAFKALQYRPSGTIYQNRVPKYDGQSCSGIQLILKDRNLFNPLLTVTSLMLLVEQLHPRQFKWEDGNYVDKLFGSNELTLFAAQKKSPIDLAAIWAMDVYKFSEFRKPFLLYK